MDGLLIVDKPEGPTSADVVRIAKRRLGCKTGHLGTLDPFASGVLPLCLGAGTKIAQFLNTADKAYAGVIRLGSATDTGDPTGTVTETAPLPSLTAARLDAVARECCGEVVQVPPMYSALKRHGTPLYKLARQGIAVEREPRRVRIDSLRLTEGEEGRIAFEVACSKGTYIRVLAQQIAAALGTVGHLEQLRRTGFGDFTLRDAISMDTLEHGVITVIGMREALRHLREIVLDATAARRAQQGYEPVLAAISPGSLDETVKLVGPTGALAAVIAVDQKGCWRFARVFADEQRAAS
jgi:tRNA pseudouridine55 synthase